MLYTQPQQGPSVVDQANEFGRHLRATIIGGAQQIEPVSGKGITYAAGVTQATTPHGIATQHSAADGQLAFGALAGLHSIVPNTVPVTIYMRINVTVLGVRQIFFGDHNVSGALQSLSLETTTANQWRLEIIDTSPLLRSIVIAGITLGWHDVVVTVTPGVGCSMHIDGGAGSSLAFTLNRRFGISLRVGAAGVYPTLGFPGQIAVTHIFNKVFSAEQRRALSANPWQVFLDTDEEDTLLTYSLGAVGGVISADGSSAGLTSLSGMAQAIVGAFGASNSLASLVGSANVVHQVSGTSSASASASPTARSIVQGTGAIAGLATVASVAAYFATTSGSSTGTVTVDGTARWVVATGGASAGLASVDTPSASFWQTSGSSSGAAIVSGNGQDSQVISGVISTSGASVGLTNVGGISRAISQGSGAVVASATLSATGAAIYGVSGSSGNIATSSGATNTLVGSFGNSLGTSSSQSAAVVVFQAVGFSASASDVNAITSAIKAAIGNSSGSSTVSGVTQGGLHFTAFGDKFNVTIMFAPYYIKLDSAPYTISI